jgi:hypothetical protein
MQDLILYLRKYIYQQSGYNVDFNFDNMNDMIKATFVCRNDFVNPNISYTKDIESYIIKKV